MTDIRSKLVHALIQAAGIQNRDGAPILLIEWIARHLSVRSRFADGRYAAEWLKPALHYIGSGIVEIIMRSDRAKGFEILAVGGSSGAQSHDNHNN